MTRYRSLASMLTIASLSHARVAAAEAPHADPPVVVVARAVADVIGVARGDASGVRLLRDPEVAADADLGALVGWTGARARVHLLSAGGGRPNDLAGTVQGIDNIELGQAETKLYEAWIEQRTAAGHVALLAGLADLNAYFYQNESAGLLIAPAFGIGSELAASGPNGPSIFPETALMARFRVTAGTSVYLQAAAVNARTGVIGAHRTLDLSMHKGALLIVEAGHGGPIKVAAGYWRYTRPQPHFGDDADAAGAVAQGGYGLLDYPLHGGDDQGTSVSLFARVGVSDGVTTPYRGDWQAGLLVGGLVPRRPEGQLSFGINQGVLSTRYCTQARHGHARVSGTETGFELTYSDAVLPHLRIQPDLQYIVGASGSRSNDVVVLGLRLTASFPAI